MANTIIGLYRHSLYHELEGADDRCMEWNFLKVREGSTGTVYVDYDRSTGIMRSGMKPSFVK